MPFLAFAVPDREYRGGGNGTFTRPAATDFFFVIQQKVPPAREPAGPELPHRPEHHAIIFLLLTLGDYLTAAGVLKVAGRGLWIGERLWRLCHLGKIIYPL